MSLEAFPHADLCFGPDPFFWRLQGDGFEWRLATLEDIPRLHELWEEMDRKFGEKQDRPDLFNMPVLLVLVAVDQNTGVIESAVYGECVVDWTMIGTSRRATRGIDALIPHLALFLFPRSIRVCRMLVPLRLEKHMEKLIPRMRNITQSFAQFVYCIRS